MLVKTEIHKVGPSVIWWVEDHDHAKCSGNEFLKTVQEFWGEDSDVLVKTGQDFRGRIFALLPKSMSSQRRAGRRSYATTDQIKIA